MTEFFVIATGTSSTQMRTVVEEVRDLGKKVGFAVWQTSGYESAKWILADCVNVVVHVFDPESRDFYDLELLWGDCPRIDWRAELGLPPVHEEEPIMERENEEVEDLDADAEDDELDDEEADEDDDEDTDDELDAPMVIEIPDESTGSNSVEFVEIGSPSKRRKRGRTVYPTSIGNDDERDETPLHTVKGFAGGIDDSLDEDDRERNAEAVADKDPTRVSKEDLSPKKIKRLPIGVSAGEREIKVAATTKKIAPSKSAAKPAAKKNVASARNSTAKSLTTAKKSPKVIKQVKSAAKSAAKKSPAKKISSSSKKSISKLSRKPAMAKAPAAKKTVAKKAPAKKTAVKAVAAKKAPAKKPVAKKAVAKKAAPKKTK